MNKLLFLAAAAFSAYVVYKELESRRKDKQPVKNISDQEGTIYDLTVYKMPDAAVTRKERQIVCDDIITISGIAMKKNVNPKNN